MESTEALPSSKPVDDPSVVVFLGLYLLLLAFFILLNSVSSIDDSKAKKAIDSVSDAFHEIMPPALRSESDLVAQGAVIATDNFQGQLKAALASVLSVIEVESLGGNLLRVDIAAEDFFDQNGEVLKDNSSIFLDHIARVFRRTESGMRREIEILIGVGEEMPTQVDAGTSLPLRQVTMIVKELLTRKVPPLSLSLGLSPGVEGNIVMFFNSRPDEETEASRPDKDTEASRPDEYTEPLITDGPSQ